MNTSAILSGGWTAELVAALILQSMILATVGCAVLFRAAGHAYVIKRNLRRCAYDVSVDSRRR